MAHWKIKRYGRKNLEKETKEEIFEKIRKILHSENRAMSIRELTLRLEEVNTKKSQQVVKKYLQYMIDKKILEWDK